MRVGVFLDQHVLSGGGFRAALSAAKSISHRVSNDIEVVFFTNITENVEYLKSIGLEVNFFKLTRFQKLVLICRRTITHRWFLKLFEILLLKNKFETFFLKNKIDLIYFTSPSEHALDCEEINYIITIWDTSHRDNPEFPEVRRFKEFEAREAKLFKVLPKAFAVVAESTRGKKDLVRRYGVDPRRIRILPFQGDINQIPFIKKNGFSNKHGKVLIPEKDYIFYPAQFWSHKNHVYILNGLKILEKDFGIKLDCVFCGADKGNKNFVLKKIRDLDLSDRMHVHGFISDSDLIDLYKHALAVVMPTYFGPTNLPPLEAFQFGVPLIYSNLSHLTEQVRGAALLVDLHDAKSLAHNLNLLLNEPEVSKELIISGAKKIKELQKYDHGQELLSLFKLFGTISSTWK